MKKYILIALLTFSLTGCKKFLAEKPNDQLALPKDNLNNLQLLLDDTYDMNQQVASAGEIATDNFYLSDSQWKALNQASLTSGNLYRFGSDVFNDNDRNDWTLSYKVIFQSNLVLDGLKDIPVEAGNQVQWNNIKGEALFFRAFSFAQLLQEYAKAYDPSTAAQDAGIALRLASDVNTVSVRSSVQQCYQQIEQDLILASGLLDVASSYKTRPVKAAAMALLSRVYLLNANYAQALNYAGQYLSLYPALLNFNSLSTATAYPIARYNTEVSFHATLLQLAAYGTSYARISDNLYSLYNSNDLRKVLYFKNGGTGNITFKGSYDGSRTGFAGLATDEVYLISAECNARLGKLTEATQGLNTLLASRWKTGTFIPFTATDQRALLQLILVERRKELVFRNQRWADLKRLNLETDLQTTVTHTITGQNYVLKPNDKYSALPLPVKVVQLSGMAQN